MHSELINKNIKIHPKKETCLSELPSFKANELRRQSKCKTVLGKMKVMHGSPSVSTYDYCGNLLSCSHEGLRMAVLKIIRNYLRRKEEIIESKFFNPKINQQVNLRRIMI